MNFRRIAISTLAVAALGLGAACTDNGTQPSDTIEVTPTQAGQPPVEVTPEETAADDATVDDTTTDDAADDTAATDDAATDDTATDDAATTEAPPAGSQDPAGDALAGIEAAIQLAEQEAGGTAYEIDDEDFDRAWEVYVLTADGSTVEVTVEADGSAVRGTQPEDTDDDLPAFPSTTMMDAINEAIAQSPGGALDEAELDTEDGVVVWKVQLDLEDGSDIEYYLDAETLDVLKTD